jgi:hypothetical protein
MVVAEARQVITSKNLSAHVSDSFQCSEQISLTIQAPDSSYFTKNSTEFQRFVGSTRSILGFECDNIKKIIITGKVNNQVVYQGRSFASEKWMVVSGGKRTVQPKKPLISTTVKSTQKKSLAHPGQKLFVQAPENFRDIRIATWNGLPRLGLSDIKGFPIHGSGQELRIALNKNKALADKLSASLKQHNYSFGLLAVLDYMREHGECFSNLETYKAKIEQCSGTVIGHSHQESFWLYNIKAMALSLTPQAYGRFFCPAEGGKPVCRAIAPGQIVRKDERNRRIPYDEFERRDWFAGLMSAYSKDFKTMWQNSRLPKEIWYVGWVDLSDYDFEKKQYVFRFSPLITFYDNLPYKNPIIDHEKYGAFGSQDVPISGKYQPTMDFEKRDAWTSAYNQQVAVPVALPMEPQQARKLGKLNKRRRFYAVTKIRLLPHKEMDRIGPPTAGLRRALELRYHLAENKVQLYQDSSLTQKIAELPIFPNAKTPVKKFEKSVAKQLDKDYQILDWETLAVLRIKKGALLDHNLQYITDTIAQREREFWSSHARRLHRLNNHNPNLPSKEIKILEDSAQLGHINWQQMDEGQKKDFLEYILGKGPSPGAWPKSFPSVNWGHNLATIFPKDHFSLDPSAYDVPVTKEEKSVVKRFLQEVSRSYPTEKFILALSLDLKGVQYDNQKQILNFGSRWPFQSLSQVDFDDDPGHKYIDQFAQSVQLVSAKAKDRAIYPLRRVSDISFGQYVLAQYPRRCQRNPKTYSENCATPFNSLSSANWGPRFFALDRELSMPQLKMSPDQGAKMVHMSYRKGWRLIVELEKVNMATSPFIYRKRREKNLRQDESQTIFASVKKATILSPNDDIIWSATRDQLKKPAKGSKLLAGDSKRFQWQQPIKLMDQIPDGSFKDFFFAKYYPDRVDQHFLEAMFSSRWLYEKNQTNPVGGRFFNQGARKPTWKDLQNSLPKFHQWLNQRANALPSSFQVQIPVKYMNNTVQTHTRFVNFGLAPDSPIRNNPAAKRLAQQSVRECKSQEKQDKFNYETCKSLQKDLYEAQDNLAKAEKAGCQQPEEKTIEKNVATKSTGSCDFSKVPINELQTATMACLTERCGPIPATAEGAANYQVCAEKVLQEIKAQMASAYGSHNVKKRQSDKSADKCKPHKRAISRIERSLKTYKCDSYSTAPKSRNCEELGKVEKATHMHVDRLQFESGGATVYNRRSRSSAALLPNATPYSDTNLSLEIAIDIQKVPYDPPVTEKTSSFALIDLDLNVRSGNSTNQKNRMQLEAIVKKSEIRPVTIENMSN